MKREERIIDDPLENDFKRTASGRLKPLLPSHKIVYRALRAANLSFGRVVNITEIIEFLTPTERSELIAIHPSPFSDRVGKILLMLITRAVVFRSGKAACRWYYGATEIINAETARMPDRKSRRERVLEVAQEAVAAAGTALRTEEIWNYATRAKRLDDFTTTMFTHDVLSLLQTGELKRVRTVRGDARRGLNLYLPSGLDESRYLPTEPLTWLEEVGRAFDSVWQRHLAEAEAENRKPLAVSTGEVRAEWTKMPDANSKAFESQPVVNAMATLSKGTLCEPPKFRKIKRQGERILLWCPPDFTDEMLDSGANYQSNFERIEVAVKRAVANTGRPVTLADVKDEIDLDPSLHPTGNGKIRRVLSDAAKEFNGENTRQRKCKLFQRIYRVGTLENESYYYHEASGLDEAYTYVKSLVLESVWSKLDFEARLRQLTGSSLTGLALGNAKLLVAECGGISEEIKSLLSMKLDAQSRERMTELLETASSSAKRAEQAISEILPTASSVLPEEIDRFVPGLTGDELKEMLMPLHQLIKSDTTSERVIAWFYNIIRRIPNPNFRKRFATDVREAAESLFDRADALIYAGSKQGGLECAFQARTAREELGRLRDARFVLPGLEDPDQGRRLITVACLAFLPGNIGANELLRLIRQDREAGVRQSALWAYCFRGENSAAELLNEVIQNDLSVHVRQFAEKCLNRGDRGWWGI